MSFTPTEEQKLRVLFTKHEFLVPASSEYLKNQDFIVNFILERLKPKMVACQRAWQRKYQLDNSDCESLMYECLLTAISNYKISRGNCKFTSFFWTITGQLFKNHLSHIYAQKRTPRKTISGDKSFSYRGDVSNETLFDVISDRSKTIDNMINSQLILEKIYDEASLKQKQVLKRLFLGKKYQEISEVLDISPSTITNFLKFLRKKYRALEKDL